MVGRRINETVPKIPKSQLDDLIIKEFHEKGHGGVLWTASEIRTKVWMLTLLKVRKSFIRRCRGCQIYNKEKAEQLLGVHSDERLNPSFPFTNICLDLFGPFEVRDCFRKCTRRKINAVKYTCLFSRAVHLDVVTDCSTEDFLQIFRRFVALRGYPEVVHSDSGTQLVGANKQLQGNFKMMKQDVLEMEFSVK